MSVGARLVVAALTAGLCARAGADTTNWIDPAGGLFLDGGNWDAGVPGTNDLAVFGVDGDYWVYFTSSTPNTEQLVVNRGDVTFQLTSRTYEVTGENSVLVSSGPNGTASLTLLYGTLHAWRSSAVATGFLSNGAMNVTEFATFDASDLVLGGLGRGRITVEDGGALRTDTAMLGTQTRGSGTVVLDGPGATWIAGPVYAGGTDASPAGNATIDINGGTFDGTLLHLWSRASVNVTGGLLEASTIRGEGTLNWTGGTVRVNGGGFDIDETAPISAALVVGAGMLLDVRGDIEIGLTAPAELTVQGGGEVKAFSSNTDTVVGAAAGVPGSLVLDGAGTLFSGPVFVGGRQGLPAGPGTLTVRGGANGLGALQIGGASGVTGAATIEDAGTLWTVTGSADLSVGDFGHGTCDVRAGAVLWCPAAVLGYQPAASGAVTVDGAGSRWEIQPSVQRELWVGGFGDATVVVSNGAVLDLNRYVTARVGRFDDSSGAVTVQGAGSRWNVGEPDNRKALHVAVEGAGVLDVLDGGAVAGRQCYIGQVAGSDGTVTVSGPGSVMELSNLLSIGVDGSGALAVADGGDVSTTGLFMAGGPAATGAITVDNAALRVIDGDVGMPELVIGADGVATVLVTNGGSISGGYAFIGDAAGSGAVTVEGAGSSFVLDDELTVGFGGTATLSVSAGGVVDAGMTVSVNALSRIDLDAGAINAALLETAGVVAGAGTIAADVVNGGTFEPGAPIGTLVVDGAFAPDEAGTGTIAFEVGGIDRGVGYDTIDVTGAFTAGGTIEVTLADGFAPAPGDAFEVISAVSVAGAFDVVALPAGLDLEYRADAIVIVTDDPCPTDIDGDGFTGFDDLLAVLAAWGPCDDCSADVDGSGTVDFDDLLLVLAAWGACA